MYYLTYSNILQSSCTGAFRQRSPGSGIVLLFQPSDITSTSTGKSNPVGTLIKYLSNIFMLLSRIQHRFKLRLQPQSFLCYIPVAVTKARSYCSSNFYSRKWLIKYNTSFTFDHCSDLSLCADSHRSRHISRLVITTSEHYRLSCLFFT